MVIRIPWSALAAVVFLPTALLAQQRRLTGSVRVEGTTEPISAKPKPSPGNAE